MNQAVSEAIKPVDVDLSDQHSIRKNAKQDEAAREARELLLSEYQGVLCTQSLDEPGFPFGSVVPYCVDRQGCPVIRITTIAQHTKNIEADPKVSLMVAERGKDDAQAAGRVTYLGLASKVARNDENTHERYYSFFPESRGHDTAHNFSLYRIELHRVRYIGGFGQIFWINKDRFARSNPLNQQQETGAVVHMNEDHADAILHYCKLFNLPVHKGEKPFMTGIDADGCHVKIGRRIHRIPFEQPISKAAELRGRLVELARRPLP